MDEEEENIIKPLYSCEEVPRLEGKIKRGCLESLAGHYVFCKTLGAGVTGVTVELGRENHKLAVKILQRDQKAVDEIHLQCRMNDLRKHSPVFGETYGWTMCETVPEEWQKYMTYGDATPLEKAVENASESGESEGFVFIAMELNSHEFYNLDYNEEDLRCMFFLLIHGLAEARRAFPYFRHRDIHSGNIMVQLVAARGLIWKEVPTVEVDVGNKHVTISHLQKVPRLIDFGEARFSYEPHPDDNEDEWNEDFFVGKDFYDRRNDLYRIGHLVISNGYNTSNIDRSALYEFLHSPVFIAALEAPTDDFLSLEALLRHDYFKIPSIQWYNNFVNSNIDTKSGGGINANLGMGFPTTRKPCINKCSVCGALGPTLTYDTHPQYKFCDANCEDSFSIWKHFLPNNNAMRSAHGVEVSASVSAF